MPWIHDDENKRIICVSEKHNRRVEIDLSDYGRIRCYECWRECSFERCGNIVKHVFEAKRPEE